MRTVLAILACSAAFAQEFDVASIKTSAPLTGGAALIGSPRGGPGSADPTHINWPSGTLMQILQAAYEVKNYQIEGPDWLRSERYDFSVGISPGATKEQVATMWRNLLASRFGMMVHKIQKEFPVDELQIGPRGHKLVENTDPVPEPGDPAAKSPTLPLPPPPGGEFKPTLNGPGLFMLMHNGPNGAIVAQVAARAQPISALATMLSNQVSHPVVDKTGLTGHYDFSIEFAPTELPRGMLGGPIIAPPPATGQGGGPAPAAPEVGIDLAGALQQQLGLRLVKGKGMLDVIVVDKAEKVPTEN
jgi:uncharacterized protein (TIGR03435 family)